MSIESAIVARTAATATLVAAIANRMYNGVAPANATRPHVVFDMIGGEGRQRAMGDAVNLVRQRVQFTVIATTATSEIATHAALLDAFDWYNGTTGGTEIINAFADDGRQTIGSEQWLPDTRVSSQDFIFLYRE
jgi:hypothetical protein